MIPDRSARTLGSIAVLRIGLDRVFHRVYRGPLGGQFGDSEEYEQGFISAFSGRPRGDAVAVASASPRGRPLNAAAICPLLEGDCNYKFDESSLARGRVGALAFAR